MGSCTDVGVGVPRVAAPVWLNWGRQLNGDKGVHNPVHHGGLGSRKPFVDRGFPILTCRSPL